MVLALLGVLSACTESPSVTYHLDVPDVALSREADRALVGWARIGLERAPLDVPADIAAVRMEFGDGLPADGVTNRVERRILIRRGLPEFRLLVIIAHEVGHAVLDTGRHTSCGIMGGSDFFPCDEDVALACERIPELCR